MTRNTVLKLVIWWGKNLVAKVSYRGHKALGRDLRKDGSHKMIAVVHNQNLGSQKVLQKTGFKKVDSTQYAERQQYLFEKILTEDAS